MHTVVPEIKITGNIIIAISKATQVNCTLTSESYSGEKNSEMNEGIINERMQTLSHRNGCESEW